MDVEKTIQFIVEQQARFDARFDTDMQKLQEMDAALGRRIDETSRQIQDLGKQVQALNSAQLKQLETVNLLIDRGTNHQSRIDIFDERMRELATAQKRTGDNLNALITVVDGLVRGKQ